MTNKTKCVPVTMALRFEGCSFYVTSSRIRLMMIINWTKYLEWLAGKRSRWRCIIRLLYNAEHEMPPNEQAMEMAASHMHKRFCCHKS